MTFVVLMIVMAMLTRIAGGGIIPRPSGSAEAMFALILTITWLHVGWLYYVIAFLWTYAWFQTGHAVAFHMNNSVEHDAANGRKAFLSHVIDPICERFNKPLGGDFYCWAFMGLKGFLMHLPLGWLAIPAAVLWPLAYFIGNRIVYRASFKDGQPTIDGEMVAEFLSGAFSGALLAVHLS